MTLVCASYVGPPCWASVAVRAAKPPGVPGLFNEHRQKHVFLKSEEKKRVHTDTLLPVLSKVFFVYT